MRACPRDGRSAGSSPSARRRSWPGSPFLTLVFTEILTNNAAAARAFPIAHAASIGMGLNFLPFGIAIAIAASAGFATPMGYQTRLMEYGAGGYRFSDYVKIGVPLDLIIMSWP